jgi:hypothetical protein
MRWALRTWADKAAEARHVTRLLRRVRARLVSLALAQAVELWRARAAERARARAVVRAVAWRLAHRAAAGAFTRWADAVQHRKGVLAVAVAALTSALLADAFAAWAQACPPPLPRTNRTSLVPPLVLSGHAASLTRHSPRAQATSVEARALETQRAAGAKTVRRLRALGLARAFDAWRRAAAERRRVEGVARGVLGRMLLAAAAPAFAAWADRAEQAREARRVIRRVAARWTASGLAAAFASWRAAREAAHASLVLRGRVVARLLRLSLSRAFDRWAAGVESAHAARAAASAARERTALAIVRRCVAAWRVELLAGAVGALAAEQGLLMYLRRALRRRWHDAFDTWALKARRRARAGGLAGAVLRRLERERARACLGCWAEAVAAGRGLREAAAAAAARAEWQRDAALSARSFLSWALRGRRAAGGLRALLLRVGARGAEAQALRAAFAVWGAAARWAACVPFRSERIADARACLGQFHAVRGALHGWAGVRRRATRVRAARARLGVVAPFRAWAARQGRSRCPQLIGHVQLVRGEGRGVST